MLNLHNVRLRSFSNLLRLLSELRDLTVIRCTAVTWTDKALLTHLPAKPARHKLQFAYMSECTHDWCAVWIMFGLRWQGEAVLDQEDWENLLPLVRSMESAVDRKCTSRMVCLKRSPEKRLHAGAVLFLHAVSRVLILILPEIYWNGTLDGIVHASPAVLYILSDAAGHKTLTNVWKVLVDYSNGSIRFEEGLLNCDWVIFDLHKSKLAGLEQVIFGFKTRDQMLQFDELVTKKTVHLPGKLTRVLRRDGRFQGEWLCASPNSDDLRGASILAAGIRTHN